MTSTSGVLVGLGLLVLTLSASSYSQVVTESADADEFRESFRKFLDMKLQEYKRDLSRVMRSHMRYKRDLDGQSSTTQWTIEENDAHGALVGGILKFFTIGGRYFLVDLYHYATILPITVEEDGQFHVSPSASYTGYDIFFAKDIEVIGLPFNDTAVFIITANHQFPTIAGDLAYTGTSTVHIWDGETSTAPEVLFSFPTNGASAVDSITYHGTLIFGVANMRSDLSVQYRNDIRIYEWKDSYFDEILVYVTHGASDLEFFKIGEELYVAVTQFVDDELNYAVGSLILKIDLYAPDISLIQTLPTTAPKSVTMYKLDHDIFLAFTNNIVENDKIQNDETDSVVYWWSGQLFLEYQRITTSGAKDMKYAHLANGDDLLLVANVDPSLGVVVYECDDEGDWALSEQQFPQWNNDSYLGPIVDTISVFELDENIYASFTYGQNTTYHSSFTSFYRFYFVNKSEEITYAKHPILSSIPELKDSITDNIGRMGELSQQLKTKVSLSANETIYSDVRFKANVTFENTLLVENFTADYYELESLVQLRKQLDHHGSRIQFIEDEISDFVSLTTEDQFVSGNVTFVSPLDVTTLNVSDAVTSTDDVINGVNITHLDAVSIKTNQNATIPGNITFTQTVTVGEQVNVMQLTNGHYIPDDYLLTTNQSQVHTGILTFHGDVHVDNDLSVNGTVNGIRIPEDLVLSSSNLHITGNKSFWGNVTVLGGIGMAPNTTMNGIDLFEFINSVYLTTDDIELHDDVHFQEEVGFQNLSILNEYIDTTNISKFRQVVKKYGEIVIKAPQTLLNTLQVDGNIFLSNKLNDVDISEDLVRTTGDQVIHSDLFIKNDVIFKGNVTVTETLNDVRPEHFFLLYQDQEITGDIYFANGLYVDGNITLANGSTINEIDLSELYKRTVMIDEDAEITAKKYFVDTVIFNRSLTVEGLINGVNITTLDEEALRVTDNITFTSDVTFEGDIHVLGDISLEGTIDDRRLEDFVTLNSPQNVTGFLTFNDLVCVYGSLILDEGVTVDNVDPSEFSVNALKNNGNQALVGHLEFTGNVTVGKNIHINGTFNGFDISEDFVTLHGDQVLYGSITVADNATFHGNLSTTNVTLHGLVNGVNITKLNEEAVRLDSNLTIYGNKLFTQNVTVDGCVFVEGTVNGLDIDRLYHEAVTLSADETISADLVFISDVNFTRNVSVFSTVNGLNLYEFAQRLVYTDTNETITGRKLFVSDVFIDGNLNVTGLINDVDLRELDRNHLSRYEDQVIPGPQTFLTNVSADVLTIGDDVLIDGVNISKVVLIDADNDIDVTLTFSDIVIEGDLNVGGYIGGFNITEYDRNAVRVTDSTVVIGGHKEFYNIMVSGDLDLNGTVNGTYLPDLFNKTLGNDNLTLLSPVVFEEFIIIEDDAWFNELVNGENISFLLEDAVRYSEPAVIRANKNITGDVEIDNLVINGDFNGILIYNNLTLREILDYLVLKSENASIPGTVVFGQDITVNGDISISGLINALTMPDDFVLQNVTQTLTGDNTFTGGITFATNVSVSNLVDTVDLHYIAANMVTLSTEQLITGTWTVAADFSVWGNVSVTGLINGFNIHYDIVTTFGDQIIYGSKTFTSDMDVLGDMFTTNGRINALPPKWFRRHVVVEHEESEISGHKVFTEEVYFAGNVTVLGYIMGVDLSEMMSNFEEHMEMVDEELISINDTLRHQCRPIYILEEAYEESQVVRFSYFEDYQTINRTDVVRIETLLYEDTLLLSLTENQLSQHCLQSLLYMYDADENIYFKVVDDWITSTSAKLFSFTYPNQTLTFVVLAGSTQSPYCTEGIDYNGITRVVLIEEDRIVTNISSETPVDSDMIEINGDLYLSIANSEDTITGSSVVSSALYRYSAFDEEFFVHQTFETQGVTTTLFIQHGDEDPWLVYANKYNTELDSGATTTDIYKWNSTVSEFEIQHQISGECIVAAVSIIVDDEPCVVAASERSSDDFRNYYMPVTTVCHDSGVWIVENTFEGQGVIGLDEFSIDGTPYLVVVSRFHEIYLYSWCGISGFELELTIPYSDVNSVHVFKYDSNLLMGVARSFVSEIADHVGETRILKGIINGLKDDTVIEV